MIAVLFGVCLYAVFSFVYAPFNLHYIHLMLITLLSCVAVALGTNRWAFGQQAQWRGRLIDHD
jgi:SSS family solute:Na+ symporter